VDRKTIIAIALCVVVLLAYRPILRALGLGHYLEPPQPTAVVPADSTRGITAGAKDTALATRTVPPTADTLQLSAAPVQPISSVLERTVDLETPLYRATFTNRGARLLSFELKHYASSHGASSKNGKPIHITRGEVVPAGDRVTLAGGPLIGLDLGSGTNLKSLSTVNYAVSESLDAAGARRVVTFTTEDASGLKLRQTYRTRSDDYAIDLEVEMSGVPQAWRVPDYSISTRSWPLLTDADLAADLRALRATSLVGTNIHRDHAPGLLKGTKLYDGNAEWAAVQTRYFMSAVAAAHASGRSVISSAERRPLTAEERAALGPGAKPEREIAINSLVVGIPSASKPVDRFVIYAGPCEYFRLASLKLQLERAVDMGWTWVLPFSTALLRLLTWVYRLVGNYGVAIVVLATLVRLLLHPLNMMSMKSMRAMQKLQPEMERLKEKYKDDPQSMNTAVMALYKENKVNPAGGCLPMVVQMPLFVALYQVLFNAIELRQAPFVGWVSDLSAPDLLMAVGPLPIRMMPLLMLGSGLLSQRLTPSDPRQLPTMYMMNVVMLVFFYNLPSGLVLYWTVMNLLTALQQWLALREDGGPLPVVPAPSRVAGRAGSKVP